jgi:iron(III) transport system permease protein
MPSTTAKTTPPVLIFWIIAGWVGFALLPWYGVEDGFWSFGWLVDGYPFDEDYAPAAFLIAQGEKLWLAPLLIPLVMSLLALGRKKSDPAYARMLILSGALGFGWLIIQGFSIGIRGFNFEWMKASWSRRPSCFCSPKASPHAARSTATSSSSAPLAG